MKTLLLILCFAAHTAFATPELEEKDSVVKVDRTIEERFFNNIPTYQPLPFLGTTVHDLQRGLPIDFFPDDVIKQTIRESVEMYGGTAVGNNENADDQMQLSNINLDFWSYPASSNNKDLDLLILETQGSFWCGSGGCTTSIYQKTNQEWTELGSVFGCEFSKLGNLSKKNILQHVDGICDRNRPGETSYGEFSLMVKYFLLGLLTMAIMFGGFIYLRKKYF
jgi:hypothetical protein